MPGSERPPGSWTRPLLAAGAVLLALLRLLLVADEEVVAQFHDSWLYAASALDTVWLGHDWIGEGTVYRPGLALFGGLTRQFGVPYRLAIECAWIGASLAMGTGLARMFRSRVVGAAGYALLLFHPWTLASFRYFLTESLFAVCAVAFVGGMLHLARAGGRVGPGAWLPWGLAVLLGFWDSIRIETMLLVPTVLAWALGVYVFRNGMRWRTAEAAAVLVVPLLGIPVAQGAVTLLHQQKFGLSACSRQEGPGYTALMDALYAVDAPDAVRHAPVTRASLARAVAASPALEPYAEDLLDPESPAALIGSQVLGLERGEFGSWLNFLLLQEIRTGRGVGADDRVMARAAAEIRSAMADGRLAVRPGGGDWPVDPNLSLWTPELPRAVRVNLGYLLDHPVWTPDEGEWTRTERWTGDHPDHVLFDKVAQRRAVRRAPRTRAVDGVALASGGEVECVTLETADGALLGVDRPGFRDAARVPLALREALAGGGGGGDKRRRGSFHVVGREGDGFEGTVLGIWRDGRRIARVPVRDVYGPELVEVTGTGRTGVAPERGGEEGNADGQEPAGPEERVFVRSTKSWLLGAKVPWQHRARIFATRWWWVALLAACVVVVLGRRGEDGASFLVGWIVVAGAGARLAFFSILVAMMGWWHYDRYVQVVQPLLVPLALAIAVAVGTTLRGRAEGDDDAAALEVGA